MTIQDSLASLIECLCNQISDDNLPTPCFCGLVPGEFAVQDYIGDCSGLCGMAWVRLVNMYPSTSVGIADTTIGNCGTGLGFDVEMGIVRCISVGESDGSPPTKEELLDSTLLQIADAEAMYKAVRCCSAIDSKDYVLGQYQPLGPDGGVVGGIWPLSLVV